MWGLLQPWDGVTIPKQTDSNWSPTAVKTISFLRFNSKLCTSNGDIVQNVPGANFGKVCCPKAPGAPRCNRKCKLSSHCYSIHTISIV